ncbi:MAG: MFS transporter [Planctomycetia bacterium]
MPSLLQSFVVVSLPITGLCYALLGSIKLPLARRLGLDEAKIGGLIAAFGLMVGPIMLLCGALADAYGRKPVWIVGSLLVAASLAIFAVARQYAAAVTATILLAAGWTAMINVANPVMATAFPDPFTGSNLGDALFGVGAFLCPVLVAFLQARVGFQAGVAAIAAVALLPFALSLGLDLGGGELRGDLAAAFGGFGTLMADGQVWVLGLALLCWVVIESGTAGWASTLVAEAAPAGEPRETGERVAATTLSAFWLCFMASRLATACAIHWSGLAGERLVQATRTMQLAIAVLAVATMAALVVFRGRRAVVATVVFAGLLCGPFFPNLIGQLFTHLEARQRMEFAGRAVAMIFACASVGWAVLPTAMGIIGARHGIRRAFLLPAACGVVLAALLAVAVSGGR